MFTPPPFIQLRGRETEIGTSISEAPSLFFIPTPTREKEELIEWNFQGIEK